MQRHMVHNFKVLASHLRRSSSPEFFTQNFLFVIPLSYQGHFPGVYESESFRTQPQTPERASTEGARVARESAWIKFCGTASGLDFSF